MRKYLILSVILLIPIGLSYQFQSASDSQGNEFNINGSNNQTIVYGDGTARYGRVPTQIEIENHTDLEVCIQSEEATEFSYRYGGSDGIHPDNPGIDNFTSGNCHSWEISSEHVDNNRFQINIWSRNGDAEYEYNPSTQSDSFLQLRYEDVKIVEKEETQGDLKNENSTENQEERNFLRRILSKILGPLL